MREKSGNRLVTGPDYMMDALKLSNQAPRVSGATSADEGERILERTWLVSPRCDVVFGNTRLRGKRSAIDCIENDTTMEDDSFRQESPVNTSRETFFFPEFDLNKFSSCKSFMDCFDQQCLEYQKEEQWKKAKFEWDDDEEFFSSPEKFTPFFIS
ncbi:hypothetical protein TNCV_1672231 [Trichonephila clavipes]|nr:hypothetical protein TNCV_1672231 [Trichonephila clavipes]